MNLRQLGLLVVVSLLFGSSYLCVKIGLEGFTPPVIVVVRCAIGALLLFALVKARGEVGVCWRELKSRPWLTLILSAFSIALPSYLISLGQGAIPSGISAVLISPTSLFVAIVALFLDRSERINRRQLVGLLVGLFGVALIVGIESSIDTPAELLAAAAMIAATACYAIGAVLAKRFYRHVDGCHMAFITVTISGLMLVPSSIPAIAGCSPTMRSTVAMVILGAGATGIGFWIFYKLISEVGAGQASLVSYLSPAAALLYGAVLVSEPITVPAVAGLGLVVVGVWLTARFRDREPIAAPKAAEVHTQEELEEVHEPLRQAA